MSLSSDIRFADDLIEKALHTVTQALPHTIQWIKSTLRKGLSKKKNDWQPKWCLSRRKKAR